MNATTTTATMTLGDFLEAYSIRHVWWVSVASPTGQELVLNEDEGAGEDYCDGETLLGFIPDGTNDLPGTVTRDSDGEYRWDVDSLEDIDIRDPLSRSTLLNLVVWGD